MLILRALDAYESKMRVASEVEIHGVSKAVYAVEADETRTLRNMLAKQWIKVG